VEAANLLVLDKNTITDPELRSLFMHVNPTHLLQLLRSFVPDQLSPNRVPAQLLASAEVRTRSHSSHFRIAWIYHVAYAASVLTWRRTWLGERRPYRSTPTPTSSSPRRRMPDLVVAKTKCPCIDVF
jgi:hypothetical protein